MTKRPKVLFYDCETKPCRAWIWRTGKQYVTHEQIIAGDKQDIICIAYKWLGSPKVSIIDWGLTTQDSEAMIETFTKVIEQADVVIAHNGDAFDIKHINTQRLVHGQLPISWPTSEDTLKMIKKNFFLPSYRLDYLAKLLTGTGKDPMSFNDWIEIVQNRSYKHLEKMKRYCVKDVRKLEQVYKRVAPFLKPRVNRSLILGRPGCPSCASKDNYSKGYIFRYAARQQRRMCARCGHNFYIKSPANG